MESSPQRREQRQESRGFPLWPLALSLALHAGVLAGEFPLSGSAAPGEASAAVLQGVLLPARPPVENLAPHAVLPAPTLLAPHARKPGSLPPTGGLASAPAPDAPSLEAGPDSSGLRQFRLSLAGEARQFRHYPAAARGAGLAGTAEVRVEVAADGLARRAVLSRSSGHAALDAAALDMLRQAALRAVLPASLQGQDFAVLLPVVFALEE